MLTEAQSAAPRPEGTLDLLCGSSAVPASARGPAGQEPCVRAASCLLPPTSGAHSPARSQQAGLIADCELVVFSFGFAFTSVSPSPSRLILLPPGSRGVCPLPDFQGPDLLK